MYQWYWWITAEGDATDIKNAGHYHFVVSPAKYMHVKIS
jgi:hypothetical protein